MEIKFAVENKTVYEYITYYNGTQTKIKVRECNTPEEAKAVANYYKVRKA